MRLPAAADPLGRADYLAVAQVGGAGKDGRNQSIFLAAALPASAFGKELAHLVSAPGPALCQACCRAAPLLLALCSGAVWMQSSTQSTYPSRRHPTNVPAPTLLHPDSNQIAC